MKKFLSMALALLMMLAIFASCAKENVEAEQSTGQESSTRPVPEAKYNPQILDAGRVKNELNTSDLWYPDGGHGHNYIYFVKNMADFTLVYVDHDKEIKVKCTVTQDNHLVSNEGQAMKFDIAFFDVFNFYDYESKTWFSRGNLEEVKASFAGKTLAQQADNSNTYVFNADGTCVETYKGSEMNGTWKITAATAIVLTFGEYDYTYDIDFDNEGKIVGISQRGGRVFDIVE